MITPDPDPTSRFPTSYCKACGKGFPEYASRCSEWERCDFTGNMPPTPEQQAIHDLFVRGECEPGTKRMTPELWAKLTGAPLPNPFAAPAMDWGKLKPPQ